MLQTSKPKVVFVTTQVAPFQAELAEAINRGQAVDYTVIFCWERSQRPKHWLKAEQKIAENSITVPPGVDGEQVTDWVIEQLLSLQPDIVLSGGVRGTVPDAAYRYRKLHNPKVKIGLWMEPPLPGGGLRQWVKAIDYRYRLKQADFVLAIGDRAKRFYQSCNLNTYFVPYGEDLSECLRSELPKELDRPIRFLFSGGLQPRHNFDVIMSSFRQLLDAKGDKFEFVISGDGPEQKVIDQAIAEDPRLGKVIRYDRVFNDWNDRLRPFMECDVFVYPTNHAGWGLVVPEAMAAGALVISTAGAESARYLVENETTGLMIEPTVDELTASLIRCFDNREWVSQIGMQSRESARRGDAPFVAQQLLDTLSPYLPESKRRLAAA